MGLFQFVKEAGEKLFGAQENDQTIGQKIQQAISALNLGVPDLSVEKQGDKLVLNGQATSQDVLEKAILAAGNHHGIGQVESNIQLASAGGNAATTASAPAQQPVFYTVKSGDTLSKIAKHEYGDANRYPEIFEANKPMLTSPDKIYPGQQLRIPQRAATSTAA